VVIISSCINFEVHSFAYTGYMMESLIFKTGHVTLTTPILNGSLIITWLVFILFQLNVKIMKRLSSPVL